MPNSQSRRRELRRLGYSVRAFDQHIESVSDDREQDYLRSLQTGFLDRGAYPAAPYAPKLLFNDKSASENVLSSLEVEFQRCDQFDISVAFVTKDGVTVLLNTLLELERREVPGRVLVSTYLGFNDPDALARLKGFSNIELRIFEGSLHSKGYLFSADGMCTLVIGSSNLTQSALLANAEWNLLLKTYEYGAICDATRREFERLWNSSHTRSVTADWLASYRENWQRPASRRSYRMRKNAQKAGIVPNKMQAEALANLKQLREQGKKRALLIGDGYGQNIPCSL